MPTKENSAGQQQPYDENTGKYSKFEHFAKPKSKKSFPFYYGGKYVNVDYEADDKTLDFHNENNEFEKQEIYSGNNDILSKDFIMNKKAKFYKKYQSGIANKNNFYINTIGQFKEVEKPNREPDYISKSGSEYWYEKDKLIRGSNHWGCCVASCDWFLGDEEPKESGVDLNTYGDVKYGEVEWKDLIQKPVVVFNGDEATLSNFDNTIGGERVSLYKVKPIIKNGKNENYEDLSF